MIKILTYKRINCDNRDCQMCEGNPYLLYEIGVAILLYQTGSKAGAFTVIRNMQQRMLPNELLMLLAMGWILESFLKGITGFGVPVAVGALLLLAVGVDPVYAVVIPLLGQA